MPRVAPKKNAGGGRKDRSAKHAHAGCSVERKMRRVATEEKVHASVHLTIKRGNRVPCGVSYGCGLTPFVERDPRISSCLFWL
jgi:hypothetical protein